MKLRTHAGAPVVSRTFRCVTKTTLSLPLTPMLVNPLALTALNAYSNRGEKQVVERE